jgi:hypothetical protein
MKSFKLQREQAPAIPEEQRQEIAGKLGIPADNLTIPVLAKISDDPLYLYHLAMCKDDPKMLSLLLGSETQGAAPEIHTTELLSRAGVAMTRWAASGFGRVPQDTYQDRIAACQSCKYLSFPPSKAIYRLAGSPQQKSVCGLCGCNVRRKAALPTEHCPDGRWGAMS